MKLLINRCNLDLNRVKIMGILNITPDSFFDGGNYCTVSKAIDRVDYMITHGATFIDIGGESTRPGSTPISDEEEANRVIPIIYALVQRFNTFISVNTSSALVIRESLLAGAHLINDVRSLISQEAMQVVIGCTLPICLVHMQGIPQTMQCLPKYYDIVKEVGEYFIKKISYLESAGISRNRLILDPGFGFGKTYAHNYQLLANLRYFHHFKLPILVGVSRKSMLQFSDRSVKYSSTNLLSAQQRLIGSVSCAVIAAMQGVHIIRVHDVKETAEALCIVDMMCDQQQNKNNKNNDYDETTP